MQVLRQYLSPNGEMCLSIQDPTTSRLDDRER